MRPLMHWPARRQAYHPAAGLSNQGYPWGNRTGPINSGATCRGLWAPGTAFSRAQKVADVEHYLTHGKRITTTIAALSYSGRGALTTWVCGLSW